MSSARIERKGVFSLRGLFNCLQTKQACLKDGRVRIRPAGVWQSCEVAGGSFDLGAPALAKTFLSG